jgi:hypothetical protein
MLNFPKYFAHISGAGIEALRYKPEGRVIDSRLCNWNCLLT